MDQNDISFEPMDIDLSNQSLKDMDISYNESPTDSKTCKVRHSSRLSVSPVPLMNLLPNRDLSPSKFSQQVVKKYHINIYKPPRSSKNRLLKIVAAAVVIIISTITYQVFNLNCCDQLNLEVIHDIISNKLYGQSAAVELLIETLDLEAKSKILFFSGGTGVGKTFTASLLLDTVYSCSNIYHYTMPTFEQTFSADIMLGLTMCKMSLIIVDDLSINDMDVKIHIKSIIEKSASLEKNITVILIYNCNEDNKHFDNKCDETFQRKVLNNFSEIKALKRFIQFEPLSEKHLRQCIQHELGNKKLNDLEFGDLLKNFNVSVDGCKGVHSKMKYLNTL